MPGCPFAQPTPRVRAISLFDWPDAGRRQAKALPGQLWESLGQAANAVKAGERADIARRVPPSVGMLESTDR